LKSPFRDTLVTDLRNSCLKNALNNPLSLRNTFQVSFRDLRFILRVGYQGYVPSVKSENVFGLTYGKTSFASTAKQIVKGMDLPPNLKYNTSMKEQFVDHSKRAHLVETTA
jgi:hypothetical protein